jgi:hypothetical protein
MSGIGSGLDIIFKGFMLSIILIIGIIVYSGYKWVSDTTIESKELVKPDYRITTDGKEIDTIYIYKFK